MRYAPAIQDWVIERLRLIPPQFAVAGGFGHALFEQLDGTAVNLEELMAQFRFVEQPNRFRAMPLNHYLLSMVGAAHALGNSSSVEEDLAALRPAVQRSMGAALLHRTMAGYQGRARVSYALKQISKAMCGIMFSDVKVTILRRLDGYRVQHRQDYNFLGKVFYPDVYMALLSGDEELVDSVQVTESGEAAWDIRVYLPARFHDMPSLG